MVNWGLYEAHFLLESLGFLNVLSASLNGETSSYLYRVRE